MATLTVACVASAVAVYGFVRHFRSKPDQQEEAAKTIQAGIRRWATFADRLRVKATAEASEAAVLRVVAEDARKRNEETTN